MKLSVNSKETKSKIQSNIVKLLQQKGTMRFTELKTSLEISKPVLSYHLGILRDNKTIEFEKKGREKHYKLGKKASELFENQTSVFSIMLHSMYDEITPSEFTSLSELLYYLGDSTRIIFLFVLLKSVKTGKDWTQSFDSWEFFREAADLLVYGLFGKNVDVEKLRLNINKDFDSFLQDVSRLSKNKKNEPLIDELLERLEEMDPSRYEKLEQLFDYSIRNSD